MVVCNITNFPYGTILLNGNEYNCKITKVIPDKVQNYNAFKRMRKHSHKIKCMTVKLVSLNDTTYIVTPKVPHFFLLTKGQLKYLLKIDDDIKWEELYKLLLC